MDGDRARWPRLLTTSGWAAHAELLARLAPHARRIESVPTVERHDHHENRGSHQRVREVDPVGLALAAEAGEMLDGALAPMRRIKEAIDPRGIMNPGKVL